MIKGKYRDEYVSLLLISKKSQPAEHEAVILFLSNYCFEDEKQTFMLTDINIILKNCKPVFSNMSPGTATGAMGVRGCLVQFFFFISLYVYPCRWFVFVCMWRRTMIDSPPPEAVSGTELFKE